MENAPGDGEGSFRIVVIPGGRMPERKSDGAIGYDVYARALVSQTEMDEDDNRLRKTLFDFYQMPNDPELQPYIDADPDDSGKLVFKLQPGKHVLIGIGIVTSFPRNVMCWLTPRSGLSMQRLTLTNAPGTIDPDYRGEAGALLVNQSEKEFVLRHHTRIAQIVFCPVLLPELVMRETVDELEPTARGGGGFGSTGLHG